MPYQRKVAALAAGPGELADLWAGTMPGAGSSSAGLLLFRDSVDPSAGQLNAPEELFAQASGILSIGVEREGSYPGDVWVVAGDRLVRVSRAQQSAANSGTRPALALQLDVQGSAKARAVAVNAGGKRKVAVAADLGLLQSP